MSKIDHSLFNTHESAFDPGPCPDCNAPLQLRHSKNGAFIGCSDYPKCEYSKPLHDSDNTELTVIEGSHCPECESELVIRKGRYGMYIACSNFPECHYVKSNKAQDTDKVECPSCHKGHLTKRANKYGKNFYPCDQYPQCHYALNFTPVAHACPKCAWPVMQEKKAAAGLIWQCPERRCGHKQPAQE